MPERNQLTRARMQGGLSELDTSQTTRNRDLFLRMRSRIVLAMKAIYINVIDAIAPGGQTVRAWARTHGLFMVSSFCRETGPGSKIPRAHAQAEALPGFTRTS
jgi:hypothetical protein